MRVRYHGPFPDGVRLDVGGRAVTVAHGEKIEVSDGLGRALLKQPDNWIKVAEKAPPTDKPAKPDEKED